MPPKKILTKRNNLKAARNDKEPIKEKKSNQIQSFNKLKNIKNNLVAYNVISLFDREFLYTKKLFTTFPDEMKTFMQRWNEARHFTYQIKAERSINETIKLNNFKAKSLVNKYHKIIKKYLDNADLVIDLQPILTELYEKAPFTNYVHKNDYESLWCQRIYVIL
nr:5482_t:CDS:2 [Entrophospora candida]CAG8618984.1 9272_t:CDS:2 [Entrophospora candida]